MPRALAPQHSALALPPVATMLTPDERMRVDAAGTGLYRTLHRETLEDVARELRARRISAVLVSVARCGADEVPRVASLVREFPRVPAVALLAQVGPSTPGAVLSLGRSGVRALVDVRNPSGWTELRRVLADEHGDDIGRLALAKLAIDLAGARADCVRFFELLFERAAEIATVRRLARQLGVLPSTLMSRFFRARLPAPKRYLATARLVRAARLFENPGLSVANVADHLEYSSPQSFGRHVRTMLQLTAVEFRRRYDGEGMFERFRAELVTPHLEVLRAFSPLAERPPWLDRSDGERLPLPRAAIDGRRVAEPVS